MEAVVAVEVCIASPYLKNLPILSIVARMKPATMPFVTNVLVLQKKIGIHFGHRFNAPQAIHHLLNLGHINGGR